MHAPFKERQSTAAAAGVHRNVAKAPLLLGPGPGQRASQRRDVRPAGAVPSRMAATIRGDRNASGSQQPDVPLDLAFAPGKQGEAADPALGQLVDPFARLGDRDQQRLATRAASSACCARARG